MHYIIPVSPSGDLVCQARTPDNCNMVIQCSYNHFIFPDVHLNGQLLESDCANLGGNCELHKQVGKESDISSLIVLLNSSDFDCNKEYVLDVGWTPVNETSECTNRVMNITISG